VGTVSAVRSQSGSSALTVEIQPAADLAKLNYLAVILYTPSGSAG